MVNLESCIGYHPEEITNCKVKYSETPTYTKKVDVGNFVVNNSKLKSLGWKQKVNLEKGIKKTLEYFTGENPRNV